MYARMLSPKCPLFGGSTVCTYVCCPQSVLYSEVQLCVHTYVVPKVSFIRRFNCMYIRMLSLKCPLFGGSTVCTYVCCPQSVLYSEVPLCVHAYVVPKVSFIRRFNCVYIRMLSPKCPLFGGSTVCTYVCCPQNVLYSEVQLCVQAMDSL